ncbi:MAG: hypothetical protein KJ592_01415 [Nanoarchaeota archaeon]|nr:hypothetical protein [Nanoarchaeota archaeon]
MEFHNFHPDKIKIINMIPLGRGSSIFVQGLLDGHPEITTIIFYYLKNNEIENKNFNDIVNLIHERIAERVSMYIGDNDFQKKFPKKIFAKYLKEYTDKFGTSTKTIFIGTHYAYTKHFQKDVSKVRYILGHSHVPEMFIDLAHNFPKQKMLFLIRDPRASFYSGKKMRNTILAITMLRNTTYLYKQMKKKKQDVMAIKHETLHTNYKKIKFELINWLKIKDNPSLNSATFLDKDYYGFKNEKLESTSGAISNIPDSKFANEKWKDELSTAEINLVQFCFSDLIKIFNYKRIPRYEPLWIEYFSIRRNLSLNHINTVHKGAKKIFLKFLRFVYMIPLIGLPLVKITFISQELFTKINYNIKTGLKIKFTKI